MDVFGCRYCGNKIWEDAPLQEFWGPPVYCSKYCKQKDSRRGLRVEDLSAEELVMILKSMLVTFTHNWKIVTYDKLCLLEGFTTDMINKCVEVYKWDEKYWREIEVLYRELYEGLKDRIQEYSIFGYEGKKVNWSFTKLMMLNVYNWTNTWKKEERDVENLVWSLLKRMKEWHDQHVQWANVESRIVKVIE